jgi:hypothetical protein
VAEVPSTVAEESSTEIELWVAEEVVEDVVDDGPEAVVELVEDEVELELETESDTVTCWPFGLTNA